MELPQRFWDKVNKNAEGGCWLWTGGTQEAGRKGSNKLQGRIRIDGRCYLVHKLSLETHLGRPLADGMVTRHKCLNSICVNPEHLEEGTQKQNCEDTIRDGTSRRGTKHNACKLIEDQVREIRTRKNESASDLAKIYGVQSTTICHIWSGKSWGWLG